MKIKKKTIPWKEAAPQHEESHVSYREICRGARHTRKRYRGLNRRICKEDIRESAIKAIEKVPQ